MLTLTLNTAGKIPHVEASRCLNEIEAAGGGKLIVNSEHVLGGTIFATCSRLDLEFTPGGRLTLGQGLSIPIWSTRPAVPRDPSSYLRAHQPRFDCSRGVVIPARLSSSALTVDYYGRFEVWSCDMQGGSWAASDSAITPAACVSTHIEGGEMADWGDVGVYNTGDGDPATDTGETYIKNVTFKRCQNGVDNKRKFQLLTAENCRWIDCVDPINQTWVGNAPGSIAIAPGLKTVIKGGEVKRAKTVISFEGPSAIKVDGLVVSGTTIKLAANNGGTLTGNIIVKSGSRKITSKPFGAPDGRTYQPTTDIRVRS